MALRALIDPLITAPQWLKLMLGGIALGGLGAICYFFAISPVESRVATLRAQRAAQQQEIAQMRAMAAELPRVRREAAEVERQLEVAKAKLPTEREMPALYRTLSDAAVQAGLAVALFQPQGPRTRDFYNEIPISLVAEGGYHELGDFVGRVATLPRATTIGELKLTGAKADASRPGPPAVTDATKGVKRPVRAEITLLTFVYRPVGSPPAPKPAGAASKPEAPKP
jgi:type IV pilus assembly protein PilO